jgi:hypothetical protein
MNAAAEPPGKRKYAWESLSERLAETPPGLLLWVLQPHIVAKLFRPSGRVAPPPRRNTRRQVRWLWLKRWRAIKIRWVKGPGNRLASFPNHRFEGSSGRGLRSSRLRKF